MSFEGDMATGDMVLTSTSASIHNPKHSPSAPLHACELRRALLRMAMPPPPSSAADVGMVMVLRRTDSSQEGPKKWGKGRLKSWTLCGRLSKGVMGQGRPPRPPPTPGVAARRKD